MKFRNARIGRCFGALLFFCFLFYLKGVYLPPISISEINHSIIYSIQLEHHLRYRSYSRFPNDHSSYFYSQISTLNVQSFNLLAQRAVSSSLPA